MTRSLFDFNQINLILLFMKRLKREDMPYKNKKPLNGTGGGGLIKMASLSQLLAYRIFAAATNKNYSETLNSVLLEFDN